MNFEKNNLSEKSKHQTTEADNLNHIARKFGDTLIIFDKKNQVSKEHVKDLGLLPDHLIESMKGRGFQVIIGEERLVDTLDKIPGIKTRFVEIMARFVLNQKKFKDVIILGTHVKMLNTAFLTTNPLILQDRAKGKETSSSVALHEYGHGVGHLLKLNKDNYFIELHKDFFKKLDYHIQQKHPGCPEGTRELVADSFADYFKIKKDIFIKKYNEELYSFWKHLMVEGVDKFMYNRKQ